MAFRTHNFSIRLTTQEIANYERLAKENGVPVSEWARNVLNWEVKYKKEEKHLEERGARPVTRSRRGAS